MSSSSEAVRLPSLTACDRAHAGGTYRGVAPPYHVTIGTAYDAAEVRDLWALAGNATVFNHPAWWDAAIAAFGSKRPLFVVKVTAGARLLGLWPLWRKRLGAREGFCRVIEPVGARVTDYCEPLIHRDHDAARITGLMVEHVTGLLDVQTMALFPKLPHANGLPNAVAGAAERSKLRAASLDHPCPAMTLPPTYAELEGRWSQNHRGDVRRRVRRLQEAGDVSFVPAKSRSDVLDMLPRLFAMHAANWNARSGFSDLAEGPFPEFLNSLARNLPMECLQVSELQLNGIAISLHFGFRAGTSLLWYKPAFDIAWANYAPGKVHVALAARHGIETGLTTFDFMQGQEHYKQLWADSSTPTTTYALAPPAALPLWAWNTKVRRFAAEYRI